MISTAILGRYLGNVIYKTAFPVYRLLYRAFKIYSDREERALLRNYLVPGSIVVDGGANIGIYTQFLSNCVEPGGTVHSFEPSPDNYRRLRETLMEYPNVKLNQLVLADRGGETLLYLSDDLNVDHRAYSSEGTDRESIAVGSTSLDDYFKPGERVDLIKLDIQGYELHALRGAERVLADNPEINLLLECWPYGLKQAGASVAELICFLSERGFSVSRAMHGGLIACDDEVPHGEGRLSYCNLFAKRVPPIKRGPPGNSDECDYTA